MEQNPFFEIRVSTARVSAILPRNINVIYERQKYNFLQIRAAVFLRMLRVFHALSRRCFPMPGHESKSRLMQSALELSMRVFLGTFPYSEHGNPVDTQRRFMSEIFRKYSLFLEIRILPCNVLNVCISRSS